MTINHVYERDSVYVVFDGPQGIGWHYAKDSHEAKEVQAYLLAHPEALIPEPKPPEPTKEELLRREEQELLGYLASTDWYASRKVKLGKEIPQDVIDKCLIATERVSEIRLMISEI